MELKSDDTGDVYLDVINDSVHTFTVHTDMSCWSNSQHFSYIYITIWILAGVLRGSYICWLSIMVLFTGVACNPIDATLVATGSAEDKGFLWKIGDGDWKVELNGMSLFCFMHYALLSTGFLSG